MKNDPTYLRRADNTIIAELKESHGQWVLEDNSTTNQASCAIHKSSKPRHPKTDALLWHRRLGHPGPSALEHLVSHSQRVRIKGITTVQCDACGQSKSKRKISRKPRQINKGPGERIAIDFYDYKKEFCTKERS